MQKYPSNKAIRYSIPLGKVSRKKYFSQKIKENYKTYRKKKQKIIVLFLPATD